MLTAHRHPSIPRALAVMAAVAAALLGSHLTARSTADLHSQISAKRSAAGSLQLAIAAESARIRTTTNGLQDAQRRLASVQARLNTRVAQLTKVQGSLLSARDHLVDLENRLQQATTALSANLVANYEGSQPDLVSVILQSHGCGDLLEQVNFLKRIAHQDTNVVGTTRTARVEVAREATTLAALEARDRILADQVLAQRNQVAALKAALLNRQIAELGARAHTAGQLQALNQSLKSLEARAAAQAARAATTGNVDVGGIAVNTGGMVQPPPGPPAAGGGGGARRGE